MGEEDSTELASAIGAEMPPEPGETTPRYARVAFDLKCVPKQDQYLVGKDKGLTSVCVVLVVAGHNAAGPNAPWLLGEALLAVFDLEEMEPA